MENNASDLDREFFEENPTAFSYYRSPLREEWQDINVPEDARVSVYKINNRSRVRVLEDASGIRLAQPIMDGDKAPKQSRKAA